MPPETGLYAFAAGSLAFAAFGANRFMSVAAVIVAGGLVLQTAPAQGPGAALPTRHVLLPGTAQRQGIAGNRFKLLIEDVGEAAAFFRTIAAEREPPAQ